MWLYTANSSIQNKQQSSMTIWLEYPIWRMAKPPKGLILISNQQILKKDHQQEGNGTKISLLWFVSKHLLIIWWSPITICPNIIKNINRIFHVCISICAPLKKNSPIQTIHMKYMYSQICPRTSLYIKGTYSYRPGKFIPFVLIL